MDTSGERWAYLSVEDTTGIVDFGRELVRLGFRLVATPGTRALLTSEGVEATPTEEITGFPIILDGMVKSLHPRVLAGFMVDPSDEEAVAECREHGVPLFELVVINSPGFVNRKGELVAGRHLEIAPTTLMRAAAANYQDTLVVTEPQEYPRVLQVCASEEGPSEEFRRELARTAWNTSIHHDILAARLFDDGTPEELPPILQREYKRLQMLRYGENPHQEAALYASPHLTGPTVAGARLLSGAPLSYNNIVDADIGLNLVLEFAAPGTAIVKHAMPTSASVGATLAESVEKAFSAEWTSRIGAAVACNGVVDGEAARAIAQPGRIIDSIIALDFTAEALDLLRNMESDGAKTRIMKAGDMTSPPGTGRRRRVAIHHVSGGVLAQMVDTGVYGPGGFHVVSERTPTDAEMVDLEFACLVAKHARSHATVLARGGATVSVATVQTNRAEASHIALERAGNRAEGAVMASDSRVNLAEVAMLVEGGIRAIIHTGGTTEEDAPLIEACKQRDVAMIVTRMRHFSHV